MAGKKVYIETSVISYLTARPSRDIVTLAKQELTREWWREERPYFDSYISRAVLNEIGKGDPEAANRRLAAVADIAMLVVDVKTILLYARLLSARAVPISATIDALHIATAAVHDIPYLLTWNCKHINNVRQKPKISHILAGAGYNDVVIATPEELRR